MRAYIFEYATNAMPELRVIRLVPLRQARHGDAALGRMIIIFTAT